MCVRHVGDVRTCAGDSVQVKRRPLLPPWVPSPAVASLGRRWPCSSAKAVPRQDVRRRGGRLRRLGRCAVPKQKLFDLLEMFWKIAVPMRCSPLLA